MLKQNRHRSLGIIILLIVLIIAIAGSFQIQHVRALQKEIQSLETIKTRYDSLQNAYNGIYNELNHSKAKLEQYKFDLDSIMEANMSSITYLKTAIEELIEKQENFEIADTTATDTFRF